MQRVRRRSCLSRTSLLFALAPSLIVVLLAKPIESRVLADEPPFLSLFDGKTLAGWTPVSTDRFEVKDGFIVGDGGTGWLRSEKPYKNFEFRADYKVLKAGSDSGIFFRATAESTAQAPNWPAKGYQLQVSDADNHLMIFGHGAALTFDRKTDALKSAVKGGGEWQTLSVKVVGKHVEVRLNDTLITESDGIEFEQGYLGLQGENGQFAWKELKVRELP